MMINVEFFKCYLLFIVGSIAFGTILNNGRVISTIMYFIFFLFLAYTVHFNGHRYYIPIFTDVHDSHHNKDTKDKAINIILEVCIELFSIGGFLLLFKNPYLTKSVIMYYPLLYTTIHFINYRYDNTYHKEHHKNNSVNYGPSMIDHLLSTNYDDSYEDMNLCIINCIIIFVVIYAYACKT
jgi:hypothetical protein